MSAAAGLDSSMLAAVELLRSVPSLEVGTRFALKVPRAYHLLPSHVQRHRSAVQHLTEAYQMLALEHHIMGSADTPFLAKSFAYGRVISADGFPQSAGLLLQLSLGGSLQELILPAVSTAAAPQRQALSAHRAWLAVRHTARAVQAVHKAGFVYNDIKPSNILQHGVNPVLPTAHVHLLCDCGSCEKLSSAGLTPAGPHSGTPEVMSPEQRLAQPVGPASDVWGLGALLLLLRCPRVMHLLPQDYQHGQHWDVRKLLASPACLELEPGESSFV